MSERRRSTLGQDAETVSADDSQAGEVPGVDVTRPQLATDYFVDQAVSGDLLRLGTLEQAIGVKAAQEFFNAPDPFDDARKAAAAKLGRLAL